MRVNRFGQARQSGLNNDVTRRTELPNCRQAAVVIQKGQRSTLRALILPEAHKTRPIKNELNARAARRAKNRLFRSKKLSLRI